MRRLVCNDGSSWMPPTSGRKNWSMMRSVKPCSRRAASVVPSGSRSRSLAWARCNRTRWRRRRTLSPTEPIGASPVRSTVAGRRNGSPTVRRARPSHTSAPGSKGRRSSAATSSWACTSGYAVNRTWKPRSRRKPSTVSVRTRPPTPSDAFDDDGLAAFALEQPSGRETGQPGAHDHDLGRGRDLTTVHVRRSRPPDLRSRRRPADHRAGFPASTHRATKSARRGLRTGL